MKINLFSILSRRNVVLSLLGLIVISGVGFSNRVQAEQGYYHGRPYYRDNNGRFIDRKQALY